MPILLALVEMQACTRVEQQCYESLQRSYELSEVHILHMPSPVHSTFPKIYVMPHSMLHQPLGYSVLACCKPSLNCVRYSEQALQDIA